MFNSLVIYQKEISVNIYITLRYTNSQPSKKNLPYKVGCMISIYIVLFAPSIVNVNTYQYHRPHDQRIRLGHD